MRKGERGEGGGEGVEGGKGKGKCTEVVKNRIFVFAGGEGGRRGKKGRREYRIQMGPGNEYP